MADRNIVFVPVHPHTKKVGDFYELSKSDRANYGWVHGQVRFDYPLHRIIITTTDRISELDIRNVEFGVSRLFEPPSTHHRRLERILQIEEGSLS